jgi:hypothetical protein
MNSDTYKNKNSFSMSKEEDNRNISNISNIRNNQVNNIRANIEAFDGIRKNNSRIIFSLLLVIIIVDFIYECFS